MSWTVYLRGPCGTGEKVRFHETVNVQISDHIISMKAILKEIAGQLEIRTRALKVKKKVINLYYQLYSELALFPLV